jgi:hypothetical protein
VLWGGKKKNYYFTLRTAFRIAFYVNIQNDYTSVSHMKSNKHMHIKHGSCLVLTVTVQNFKINTPNSLTPGTSKETDRNRKASTHKIKD